MENERLQSVARELVAHEVLVVDTDPAVAKGMVQLLAPIGLHVTATSDREHALELLGTKFFGVAIVDLDTPTPNAGVELVKKIHEQSPTSLVLVLSPRKSFDAAVQAFRAGAHDVIMKAPDQVEYLKARVLSAAGGVAARGATGTLLIDLREMLADCLKQLMEAERRALELEDKVTGRESSLTDIDQEMRVLLVDSDDRLYRALEAPATPHFSFAFAQSGGEALDRVTNASFHMAIVGAVLPDLPGTMIVKALKAQAPELIVMHYERGGRLEIMETTRAILIVEQFNAASQLTERLDELAQAHRAKSRERRYLSAFRLRHYEFLRHFSELRRKLDKAIADGEAILT
jgi:DNA-binding NtrC family response regulator